MQIKHIYVGVCHIVLNELSEKVIYLCYYQSKLIKRNMYTMHVYFQVISFVNSNSTENLLR